MFTIRNMGGVALLLYGSTFLWLTPAFASRGISTAGPWWAVTRILAITAMIGFTGATVGLFLKASWWLPTAILSAVIGSAVLIPYWVAAHSSGEVTPWWNVFVHAIGNAGVFVLLLVPTLQRWVQAHVMSGR